MKRVLYTCRLAVLIWGVLTLFTACRTTKTPATGGAGQAGSPLHEMVERVATNRQNAEFLTAKLRVKAQAGDKRISLGGSLKMKRDDVVQLSLTAAFGLIEAGRMEFTQDYVMIVDRLKHRYIKAAYNDLPFLAEAQIDFNCIQALFWNELYVPGAEQPVHTAYKVERTVENKMTLLYDQGVLAHRFIVDTAEGLLTQTCVGRSQAASDKSLQWAYAGFTDVDKHAFPTKMDVSLLGPSQPFVLSMSLNNIRHDKQWDTRTTLSSSRYQQIDVQTLLNRLFE